MHQVTTSGTDLEVFRKRWIDEFEVQARSPRNRPHRFWEGPKAFAELNRTNNLGRVLPNIASDHLFSHLTFALMREVRGYKRCVQAIDANHQCFGGALEALIRAEAVLRKAHVEEAEVKREIEEVLARTASMVEEQRRALERRRDSYWDDVMLASLDEWSNWPPDFNKGEWISYGRKRIPTMPPEEFAAWSERFNKFKYPRKLTRRIDLDSRFQVRFAVVLRHYLQLKITHVSLTTIARLVVLTYICGGLAGEQGGKLTIAGTGKRLTVGAVDQKLREAGLK
jgi:hypothetical protein